MIDINILRKNPDKIKKACEAKNVEVDIDRFLELDKTRGKLIKEIDDLKAEQGRINKQIQELQKSGKHEEIKSIIEKSRQLKEKIKELEPKLTNTELAWKELLLIIPNIPADDVKVGKDESENEIIKKWGKPDVFSGGKFPLKDYMELAKKLDLIDTERAAKISGTRFGFIKNQAVILEFALVRFAFDILQKEGFKLILPPVLIKKEVMEASGHLMPWDIDERYYLPKDDLFLVGTSEQSVVPYFMNETLEEKDLPHRFAAFSTCFRREAGSYGKDTKGILRVHQFDKVEMVSFTLPEKSDEEHEFLLKIEEKLMQTLKIPYQVVKMCTGDLGASAARKYDIEAWIPSENRYRETHSTSNCTDFQARRLNIRLRRKVGLEFVHTLNGTALAIGRTLIAIIENYQRKDGSIEVPKALQKYCGFKVIKQRNSA